MGVAGNRHDDVLLAVMHVAHRRLLSRGRNLDTPEPLKGTPIRLPSQVRIRELLPIAIKVIAIAISVGIVQFNARIDETLKEAVES